MYMCGIATGGWYQRGIQLKGVVFCGIIELLGVSGIMESYK